MKVLVDTSIWSLALRHHSQNLSAEEQRLVDQLKELISENRAVIIGPIRQEILSGIAMKDQYDLLKKKLRAFPDLPITTEDYEDAAELFNLCRQKGIAATQTDFLISAVAVRHNLAIFTTDQDFYHIQNIIGLELI